MADIRALAGKLGGLSQGQIEATLQGFLETGKDRGLSRLLQVCAFNAVKLDPEVLCACIGVCEDILDSAPCFALQDEHAIEPVPTRNLVPIDSIDFSWPWAIAFKG
jgi:hypothetical protein